MSYLNFILLTYLSLFTHCKQIFFNSEGKSFSKLKSKEAWNYPFAPNDTNAGDVYWGNFVEDPYRPLQYPFDSKTLKYIEESNAFTNSYLNKDTSRQKTRKTIEEMYNYKRTSQSVVINGTTYQLYNPGLYSEDILVRKAANKPRETLVDPRNLFELDTTKISCFGVSQTGKYLAYALNRKGSDWQTFFVIDLATGKLLNDRVNWGRYNGALVWKEDEGFFYEKFQQPPGLDLDKAGSENNKVVDEGFLYHKIGTDESSDVLVKSSDKDFNLGSKKLYYINNRYLLTISTLMAPQINGNSGKSKATLIEFNPKNISISKKVNFVLSGDGSNYIEYLGSDKEGMEFITDKDANYRQLIKVKFENLDKYEIIVKEVKEKILYKSINSGSKRVNFYYWEGVSSFTYTEKEGDNAKEVKLPFGDAYTAKFSKNGKNLNFKLASFLYIYQKFQFNFNSKKLKLIKTKKAPKFNGHLFDQYLTHYKAKDGQKIPIFLVHKKGIKPDKSHVGILYGYGGFDIQLHPSYTPKWSYLLKEKNMVLAYALIRGGGEKGEDWWKLAVQKKKPLSYSDFSDAVDFLHKDHKFGFIGKKKQFINGGSNGGLLTAATCNLIPEKLGGCIADVGVMDILRYKQWTGGFYWEPDYGFPEDSKEMFDVQMTFSPYQNVLPEAKGNNGKHYPPYLINTSNYDDRVSPVHSLKLAAKIQNLHRKSPNPVLLYIEQNSGHSPSNLPKRIDNILNMFSLINLSS